MKQILAIGTIILAGITPIVPHNLTFAYAYSGDCAAYVNATTDPVSSSTPNLVHVPYIPQACIGNTVGEGSVSVFTDEDGNEYPLDTPITTYRNMEGKDGGKYNPDYTQFKSILDLTLPQAHAAVATTAQTALVDAGGANVNSLTYSVNCAGGTALLVSMYNEVNTAGDTTGITYNSVSMTKSGVIARPSQNRELGIWGLQSPSGGANNVVVSRTTTSTLRLASGATCWSGTQTTSIPSGVSVDVATSSVTNTDITATLGNGAGAAVFGIFNAANGGQTITSGGTILSSDDINSQFVSSPLPANANQATTGHQTGSATMSMIMVALELPAATDSSYILFFQ